MAPGQSGRHRLWTKIGMPAWRCGALRNARRASQPFWSMPGAGGMADMEQKIKEREGPKNKKKPQNGALKSESSGARTQDPNIKSVVL